MIVTLKDVRTARLCLRGARGWFARHRLDYRAFVERGLPADVLAATGCEMARRAIAEAERRLAREAARHG